MTLSLNLSTNTEDIDVMAVKVMFVVIKRDIIC